MIEHLVFFRYFLSFFKINVKMLYIGSEPGPSLKTVNPNPNLNINITD